MSTVKGILKGLRYISQIFENEKEEEEIQIGAPTDVKHVAHIGNEGPSTNKPSWMKEVSSEAKSSGNHATKSSTKDVENSSDAPSDSSSSRNSSGKTKQSKRHAAKAYIGSITSQARETTSNSKPRRNKNTNAESQQQNHTGRESPSRRPKKTKAGANKSKAQNHLNDNFSSSSGPGYDERGDNGKISQKSAS